MYQYQIFKHGTLFFSRDSPNISTVIPAMDHIDEYLATACGNVKLSKAIRAALDIGKQTLNRYYDKTDHSDVYRIAMGMYLFLLFVYLLKVFLQFSTLDINYNTLKKPDGRKPGSKHLATSSVPNLIKLTHSWMSKSNLKTVKHPLLLPYVS